jgi:DNA-binding NarL/FixJ family response regulator
MKKAGRGRVPAGQRSKRQSAAVSFFGVPMTPRSEKPILAVRSTGDSPAGKDTLYGRAAVSSSRTDDPPQARTFIAAQNRLLRETLSRSLTRHKEFEVVGQSSTFPGMAELLQETKTEILLLNSTGSQGEDMPLVHAVRRLGETIRIVMMGMRPDGSDFLECVRAGVKGYLLLDASAAEVIEAILVVRKGGAACPPQLCRMLFQYFQQEMGAFPSSSVREQVGLTAKEQQILRLVAQGMTNKEIANQYCLSEQTVKNHLYRMNQKIGTEDRLDIVRYCRARGVSI